VGSTQLQTTDVRLVAATNRDPERAVEEGRLREDLLYRLNVFPIHVPPLRERREDVALLARHFLAGIARREGRPKRFAPEVLDAFAAHTWPGNVRELRNAVERAYVMAPDGEVVDPCLFETAAAHAVPGAAPDAEPIVSVCVGESWAAIERQVVLATLQHFNGHQQRASMALGVSVKTLYNRLREWSVPAAGSRRHGADGLSAN
jgi:DNA-binding NtrC family response regulator